MTLDDLIARYPGAVTFQFGDGPDLSSRLIALVRSGAKTATCGALRDFGDAGEPLPVVGRRDIVLGWDGVPEMVIETTEVTIRKFNEVGPDFALAEGENDSLQSWQADHRAYFERNGGWSPDMDLVCERFRVIEDLRDV